jgi:ribosomal protein L11 methylase PrmA
MFEFDGELYRAVNHSYKSAYDHLLSSGLYQVLVDRELLVPFKEEDPVQFGLPGLYKVLKPERIRFISYPYEWAFNMLKDAALLTLDIQKLALEHGMSLKDASAFNVQFQNGKPVFIDTLSFELYPIGRPWVAYRQFCQHFLAPLALMARVDLNFNRMFIIYLDGIPLNLAAKMLSYWSRFSLGLYLHIFLHAKAQKKHEGIGIRVNGDKRAFSLNSMKALVEGLKMSVETQRWKPAGTEWADYTDEGVHTQEYTEFKTKVISGWLDVAKPQTVWDLGANTGYYSRLAAQKGIDVISFDVDPACVKKNYAMVRKNKETNILPLLLDLLNASPSLGWKGTERFSFYNRNRPELVMALAIIHHLAISANIPLESIASHFAGLANFLIIEFVPKEDEKVQLLLLNREDIFPDYTQVKFEIAFSKHYLIEQEISSDCTHRVFYLMKKK